MWRGRENRGKEREGRRREGWREDERMGRWRKGKKVETGYGRRELRNGRRIKERR